MGRSRRRSCVSDDLVEDRTARPRHPTPPPPGRPCAPRCPQAVVPGPDLTRDATTVVPCAGTDQVERAASCRRARGSSNAPGGEHGRGCRHDPGTTGRARARGGGLVSATTPPRVARARQRRPSRSPAARRQADRRPPPEARCASHSRERSGTAPERPRPPIDPPSWRRATGHRTRREPLSPP